MSEKSEITFEEFLDPFPSEDIFDKGNTCLSNKYKELSQDSFGETDERMTRLIVDFKEVMRKKGIEVPGIMESCISTVLRSPLPFTKSLPSPISLLPEYDHFYKKLLRAGGCDVNNAIKVLHGYLSTYHICPHFFQDILPIGKNEEAYNAQFSTVLPHRWCSKGICNIGI